MNFVIEKEKLQNIMTINLEDATKQYILTSLAQN